MVDRYSRLPNYQSFLNPLQYSLPIACWNWACQVLQSINNSNSIITFNNYSVVKESLTCISRLIQMCYKQSLMSRNTITSEYQLAIDRMMVLNIFTVLCHTRHACINYVCTQYGQLTILVYCYISVCHNLNIRITDLQLIKNEI